MDQDKRTVDVPVGIERVLFMAAAEPEFRRRLLEDRQGAVAERGLKMRPFELAMLAAVPEEQLLRNIAGIDTSRHNLERRSFLRAVAASAAALAATGAAGCGDGDKEQVSVDMDIGPGDRGARPDMGVRPDMDGGLDVLPVKEQGVMKDAGVMPDWPQWDHPSPPQDGEPPDTVPLPKEMTVGDAGVRPPKPDGPWGD